MLIYLIIASVCYLGRGQKHPRRRISFLFCNVVFHGVPGLDLSSKVDGFYYHDF